MSMNPFNEKPLKMSEDFYNWNELSPRPYNKFDVDPYTRVRVILACGAEFEAVWFSHQFHRHEQNNDLRRELAVLRRKEQQQQKRIAALKPIGEGILEHTIGYEQLAVDLTAIFAERETNKYVKQAMDFALLEDFDHLYRYSDLLEMDKGIEAEQLVGGYTELMPGRPTIAEHRFPTDEIKRFVNFRQASALTKLDINILTAAEQQTMNYYMNQANFYQNKLGRQLYTEIAMIEEQHVSLYGGLKDTTCTWLEELLMHEYTECYCTTLLPRTKRTNTYARFGNSTSTTNWRTYTPPPSYCKNTKTRFGNKSYRKESFPSYSPSTATSSTCAACLPTA